METCPVCGGPTVTSNDGAECVDGHRFEPHAFEMEKGLEAVRSLWSSVRALEDHAAALRWSARHAAYGSPATDLDDQAAAFDAYAQTVRELVEMLETRRLPHEVGVRISSRRAGTDAVVTCVGDIDLVGTPRLRDELVHLAEGGVTSVLVDLSAVPMIDSSGMAALVFGRRRFDRFAVRGLKEVTRAAFIATGLDLAIEVVD